MGTEAAEYGSDESSYAQNGFMIASSLSFLCREPDGVKETGIVGDTGREADHDEGDGKEHRRAGRVDYQKPKCNQGLSAE